MEWRVIKTSCGWYAQLGSTVKEQKCGWSAGYILPAFYIKESARFNTEGEALAYIKGRTA